MIILILAFFIISLIILAIYGYYLPSVNLEIVKDIEFAENEAFLRLVHFNSTEISSTKYLLEELN